MKGVLKANIRFHGRRYFATGLAVIVAVVFVVISLSLGNAAGSASKKLFSARYEGAVASVSARNQSADPNVMAAGTIEDVDKLVDEIKTVPEVGSVAQLTSSYAELVYDGAKFSGSISPTMPEGLYQPKYQEGSAPTTAGQISLDSRTAKSLRVSVGEQIQVKSAYAEGAYTTAKVVGIYGEKKSTSLISLSTDAATMTLDGLVAMEETGLSSEAIAAGQTGQGMLDSMTQALIIQADNGATDLSAQEQVTKAINAKLGSSSSYEAKTIQQVTDEGMEAINMSVAQMNLVLMIFPAIAIVVAIIVISTTFQVIVQQRQRELALLRCLGASTKQVRRLILGESTAVGAVASFIGVIVGAALAAWGVTAIGLASNFGEGLAAIGWQTLLAVFIVGVLVTVVAGAKPAFKVAKTSPMQALNPAEQGQKQRGVGWWVRLILGLLIAVGAGAAMMFFAGQDDNGSGSSFGFAILAGIACLLGVVLFLSAVFPYLTTVLAIPFRGMLARLSAGNAVRNPGRTAATGVSVVIGVTLIVMMMVGSGSLRTTVNTELDRQMPVDLMVSNGADPISAADAEKIAAVNGITKTVVQRGFSYADGATFNSETVAVIEANPFEQVARSEVDLGLPTDDQAYVAPGSEFAEGQSYELCRQNTCKTLLAVESSMASVNATGLGTVLVSSNTLAALGGTTQTITVLGQLQDSADYSIVETDITRINPDLIVSGAGPTRAMFETILNIMLAVVIALLGVSVLVALIGVSNTLSLSVAERTRENGLLRALGMTKRQVSRMLTNEAIFISLTAALVGTGLGIFFGWAGMKALPLNLDKVIIAVPWWQIGVVILVSIVAAVLAAWLPGRKAAKTSPVEALAAE